MKNTVSIKNSGIFSKTIYKGKSKADKALVIYILPNGKKFNRIGISVGKKVGNSVQRNRIKRLIRESYRYIEKDLKIGYDIVFIPRKYSTSKGITLNDISPSVKKIFNKLNILKKE